MTKGTELPKEMIELDYGLVAKTLATRIADYLKKAGRSKAVIGLSGGLDSAVVAALAKMAIGSDKIICVLMPTEVTSTEDLEDAAQVARQLGISTLSIPMDGLVASLENALDKDLKSGRKRNPLERGNISARLRMILLHDIAARNDALVIGTGDKSELLIGYFTKFGDGGVDLLPIGDLYKTQVRRIAESLGLPRRVYTKPSSPNLWPNQTAEGEFGMSYEAVDTFLWAFFEKHLSEEKICAEHGIPKEAAKKILKMVSISQHKRNPPVALKISSRSLGSDWRYPVQMGYDGS